MTGTRPGLSAPRIRPYDSLAGQVPSSSTAPEGEAPAEKESRFRAMSESPVASVGKAIDRVHNVVSMVGVFTPEKVARYIAESEDLVLPMMKAARRRFPRQIPVYEISKLMISTHIHNIRTLLGQPG